MHRKQTSHQRTRPESAGHLPKYQKQRDRRCRVQQNIRQVVRPGMQPKKLTVQQVRQPCERVPVRTMLMREHPGDCPDTETARNLRIVVDVTAVVEIDELVTGGLTEHQSHRQQQKNANGQHAAPIPRPGRGGRCDLLPRGRPLFNGALIVHRENHLVLGSSHHPNSFWHTQVASASRRDV